MDLPQQYLSDCTAAMAAWMRDEDPLLGAPPVPDAAAAIWRPLSGRAIGVATVAHTPLDSPLAMWNASTVDRLQLRLEREADGADVAEVLDAWLAVADADVAEPGGDHARVLRLPVIARQAVLPLIERGFAPAAATLARPVRAGDADDRGPDRTGLTIRGADVDDRPAMLALMRELIATEAQFGCIRARDPALCEHYVDEALACGPDWTLVAEADSTVVGWASLQPPEQSQWAAASVAVAPVAYLGIASVTAARRSAGIGRALATGLHRQAAAARAAVVLLDACPLNPWSTPFWHRLGYRPLWTTWQRRRP